MIEAVFPIHSKEEFLQSVAAEHELMFVEEFHEKYFVFKTSECSSLELKISDEGNQLIGRTCAPDGAEIISYPVSQNIANLKEILTTTVGLDGELSVRQMVHEAGSATFSICTIEDKGTYVRLQSYNKNGLKELADTLHLNMEEALKQSLLSLAD